MLPYKIKLKFTYVLNVTYKDKIKVYLRTECISQDEIKFTYVLNVTPQDKIKFTYVLNVSYKIQTALPKALRKQSKIKVCVQQDKIKFCISHSVRHSMRSTVARHTDVNVTLNECGTTILN